MSGLAITFYSNILVLKKCTSIHVVQLTGVYSFMPLPHNQILSPNQMLSPPPPQSDILPPPLNEVTSAEVAGHVRSDLVHQRLFGGKLRKSEF